MPANAYANPDALLVTAPGCPHCAGMERMLRQLVTEGDIAHLVILDASREAGHVRQLGVKSVPWMRLGNWVFEGQMPLGELREWAAVSRQENGVQQYFFHMLKCGRRDRVEAHLRTFPAEAAHLAALMHDPEASMAVRLGIGAVLEEMAGTGATDPMVPVLAAMLEEQDPRNRADAAHFLNLVGNREARQILRRYIADPDPEVREIALEAQVEST